MGLIEYLPDDDGLFAEAARLLRPGGRFAVSCRNRLYNLLSVERLHGAGARRGSPAVAGGAARPPRANGAAELHALAESLAASAGELERAAAADRDVPPKELHDHRRAFQRGRRQHTPRDLAPAAERHGFREAELLALHPHPLPPALEALAPRTYNRLADAWQRALERSPAGLAFSTAFVAVFERA